MNNDLDIIHKTFPHEWEHLNVYAIGDVHVGSPNFNETAIQEKLRIIEEDEYGVVCLCGDLGDFGLKNSKTNVYQAVMQPKDQIDYIYELFKPIADKIISAVPGNHEERLVRECGIDPLLTLCTLWRIEEVYRENVAITKLAFGNVKGDHQQIIFYGITTHGSTRNKHKKFISGFDGIDFAISGHTHTPEYSPHGKIRIDRNSGTANHVGYKEIVVDANLSPGGYGLKHEYEICPPPELQYLELRAYRDNDRNRTLTRVMNYHTLTI